MPGFLHNTCAVMRRETGRITRQPMYFVLMIVLPVVSFAFFALLFNQGAIRNIPIAVLDQDNTTLSRKAVQMIDDTPTAMVAYGIQGMDEGERLMREGRIMAIVQIPAFFEKNILSNSQTHLENYVSGTNITVNGLLSKDIQTAVTTFTAGIQLQVLMKQGLTQRQAMAQLMPVRFDKHVLFNPHINYGYYLSPSFMPMMLMIFVVMVTVFAIGTELKHATAREWLGTGNGSVAAALAGKVLPITAVMFLISLVMLVINFKIVGTPLNGSLAVILAGTLLFILSYQSISVLIVSLLANLRLSLSIGGGYSVLAFTFSGLTFPIMAMWEPMQWVSKIFPFTFYTDIFVDQMLRGTPWAYSLAYGSQVLRNVPIGVVDECRTPTSRSLIDTFNAGPNTYVAYNPTSMEEAKELFYGRKIYGVVYIPSDYGEKLYGGEQANVAIYADASYFLMYRQVFQEVVTSIGKTGAMVEFQRLIAKGANIPQAQATTQPVIYQSHNLFNPYLGYGTFVMPAIIMVIIQQTMLIGIGMIGGTWREFGLYRKLCPAGRRRMSTLPIVLGRGLVYALIYAVTCTYILGLHYRLFHFPMNGATGAVMLFMAAYLAACIAMGIAVSTLFRYRENSLLLLLWTSIPVLMLSGVSYPRQGIPDWLFNLGQLFPSSHGVNGFIRIQTMGASIPEVFAEIKWLIILTVVYGGLACIGIHQVIGREQREHPVRKENGDEGC